MRRAVLENGYDILRWRNIIARHCRQVWLHAKALCNFVDIGNQCITATHDVCSPYDSSRVILNIIRYFEYSFSPTQKWYIQREERPKCELFHKCLSLRERHCIGTI